MDKERIAQKFEQMTSRIAECNVSTEAAQEFLDFLRSHTRQFEFDMIFDWIDLLQVRHPIVNKKVLDVGCRYGLQSIMLAYYNNEVAGFDIDKASLTVARMLVSLFPEKKIMIKENDSENIEFQDNSFDVAYCNEFVSHVFDLEASLKEIRRVLKKDGQILVSDCDKWNLVSMKLMHFTVPKRWEPIFERERKLIIEEIGHTMNVAIDIDTIKKMARRTRGWSQKELRNMVEKYSQGETNVKKLLSMYSFKFPWRHPRKGAYAERLFSPSEIKRVLLKVGFSKAFRVPLSTQPNSLKDKLRFHIGKLKGDFDIKYLVVGIK